MTSDDILNLIGGYGRFQILVFMATGLVYLSGGWFAFAPIFLGYDPGYHCRIPLNSTANESIPGRVEQGVWVLEKCEMFNVSGKSASATREVTNATRPCDNGWTYLWDDTGRTSFVSEWDLVCEKNYLTELSTTVFMAGGTVGAIFLTSLSDLFGRKWVMLVYFWLQSALQFGLAWADNIVTFTVVRFFIGALNMGSSLVAFVMMIEVFPSSHRVAPSILFQGFWSAGVMTFALFGYLIYDWRYLQMAISLPSFLTIAYVCVLPESILWLISKGRLEEAETVLRSAVKTNNKELPSDITAILQEISKCDSDETEAVNNIDTGMDRPALSVADPDSLCLDDVSASVVKDPKNKIVDNDLKMPPEVMLSQNRWPAKCDGEVTERICAPVDGEHPSKPRKEIAILSMFKKPKIRIYCLVMFYLFFVTGLSYFGTIFSTPTLAGNRFLNLFLSGAIEIPAILICVLVNRMIGRRIPICVFLMLCSAMNMAILFLPAKTDPLSYFSFRPVLHDWCNKGRGMCYPVCGMVHIKEPLLLIADGFDLGWLKITLVMIGKFGITGSYAIIYMYAAELFPTTIRNHALGFASFFENVGLICAPLVVYSGKIDVKIPLVIFSVSTAIGGVLVLILPETHRRPLPQTISEVLSWKKHVRVKHN